MKLMNIILLGFLLIFILLFTKEYFTSGSLNKINPEINSNTIIMDNKDLSKKTVKIISQKITYDWIYPYKNKKPSQSIGSGFFIDKEHIITCSHVIEDSKVVFIEIPFIGSDRIPVDVIGLCPDLDIALLKVRNNSYKNKDYYELHYNKKIYEINSGVDVFAIGFPLGQDNLKITKGIISGRDSSLIQTDTPINPGNSGGPLILDNKVIGINASHIRNASNIGYAIPISHFYLIKNQLFNSKIKLIRRPFLGMIYQNSNQALLDLSKCKCKTGILVKQVFKNSPISKSGIKKNDIICKINDIEIDNFGLFDIMWFNEKMNLGDILKQVQNNELIKIEYWRNNVLHKKKFNYNDYKLPIRTLYHLYENYEIEYEIFGGFIVMELTNNHIDIISEKILSIVSNNNSISQRLNNFLSYLDKDNKGDTRLLITHIFPNSYLKNLKILHEYEIIDTVNNVKCNTIKEYRDSIKKTKSINNEKYIEINTEVNSRVVLSLNKILEEENGFSKSFKYKLSELYYHFKKNTFKNTFKKSKIKNQKKTFKKSFTKS